jgi:lysophospholipase L1-like esterase
VARVAGLGGAGNFVPVFVAGEIDVRCHLPGREPDFGFVRAYVDRAMAVANTLHAPRVVFVVPPPPSATCPNIEEFPIKGSIGDRVLAFDALRVALAAAVADHPRAELLDATDALRSDDGSMRQELTDDGCHTNSLGVAIVRARVEGLQLDASRVAS